MSLTNARMRFALAPRQLLRGVPALVAAYVLMASCTGGETTAPPQPPAVATSVRVTTNFPELARNGAFSSLASFSRVHAVLLRTDGRAALDTTLSLTSSSAPLTLDLSVRISASAPASGEPMTLELGYLTSDGTLAFRAGPSAITVAASPASVALDAMYAGPGASAKSVLISPRTLSVDAGGDFAFTAAAADAAGAMMQNAPIEWISVDTARAAISVNSAGAGKARNRRGPTQIIARLITGQADTVSLDVRPVASSIALLTGNGQTVTAGGSPLTLPRPLVVKVMASDGLGAAGVTVSFATQNGGSLSPATAVTDSTGAAQASWTLASSVGLQMATASAAGLAGSPVTFTATATDQPPSASRRLSFVTAPAQGISVAIGQPFTLTVAALDAAGNIDTSFTEVVSLSVASGPTGSAILGPPSLAAIAGVATFYYEMIQTPGNGYVISASASGIASGSTPSFNVPAFGAGYLYWLTIPFSPYPTEVTVTDVVVGRYGGATGPVTLVVTAGGGTFAPVPPSRNRGGAATVDWTLGTTPGVNTLTAYSPGLAPVSITTIADFPQLSMDFRLPTLGARQHNLPYDALIGFSGLREWSTDVQLTHTQPSVVALPASPHRIVTFPRDNITVEGLAPGVDTITVSAPKYLTGKGVLRVTLPVLSATAIPRAATTQLAPEVVTLSARDAVNSEHLASDTVVIHAVSSDPSVIRPSQPYIRIPKNESFVNTDVIFVGAGTAHMTYSDSGGHSINYVAATTNDVVVTLPQLGFDGYAWTLGARQHSSDYTTILAPQRVSQPLTISLTSSDTTIATVPATVTIPTNGFSRGFTVTAHDVIGTAQITATAPGFAPVTRTLEVTRPRFLTSVPSALTTVSSPLPLTVRAMNTEGIVLPVTQDVVVTLASLTPGVATLNIPSVTIRAGFAGSNQAILSVVGPGTARITASDARTVPYAFVTDTATINVTAAAATFSSFAGSVGIGQYFQANLSVGSLVSAPLTVPITHSQSGIVTTPTSVVVDQARNLASFTVEGAAAGTATITASPPGYVPATAAVTVGPGTFRLGPWPSSLRVGDSLAVWITTLSPAGWESFVVAATTVSLAPSANIQFVSGVPNSAPLTSVTVAPRTYYTMIYLKAVAAGAASVSLTAPTYTSLTATTTVLP